MKIELIKDHVLGKKGDTVSVSQPRGDYLIRMGVAEKHVAATVEEFNTAIGEKLDRVLAQTSQSLVKPKPKPKKATKTKTKTK